MKYDEIVQALRCCSYGCVCEKCPSRQDENCIDHVNVSAAAAIKRLVAENAALRKSIPQWIGVDDKNQKPRAAARTCDGRRVCRRGLPHKRGFVEKI